MRGVALPIRDETYRFVAAHPAVTGLDDWGVHKVLMRFAPGAEHYAARTSALGLTGFDTVLDAGCGYGQWTLALARQNRRVVALDHSDRFLGVASPLLRHYAKNVVLVKGSVEDLPLPDASVDAVLCAEVLLYTDEEHTLREFFRVLKPGGRLYLLTAGLGYHLEYVRRNWMNPVGAKEWLGYVGRTLLSRISGGPARSQVAFLTGAGLRRRAEAAGFSLRGLGPESSLDKSSMRPMRRGQYCGCYAWVEISAQKPQHATTAAPSPRRTQVVHGRWGDAVVAVVALALVFPWLLAARLGEWLMRSEDALIPTVAVRPEFKSEISQSA